MNTLRPATSILATLCLLSACASTGDLISAPGVSLRNVEITDIDFSGQTFLLHFDVTNPNPFPLPVSTVSYAIELDGHRFASGSTAGGFAVPSAGDDEFTVSVDLNLMKTAPQLLFVIRDSVKRDIPYTLSGQFGLDIPFAPAVRFDTSGAIRMQSVGLQALKIP
jgi:LEA14-like dessication related protein